MDQFSVRTQQLMRESDDITKIARRMQEIGNIVSSVRSRLDWDVKQKAQINSTLSRIRNNTVTLSSKTNILGKKLGNCARKYDDSENRILNNGGSGKNAGRPGNPGAGRRPSPFPDIVFPNPGWPKRIPYIPSILPGILPVRPWQLFRFAVSVVNNAALIPVGPNAWNPSRNMRNVIEQVLFTVKPMAALTALGIR